MSERYSKLFDLPPNLYAEGAPVIVSAGALYFDNKRGKCVAQLKIKNISESEIKAVSVKIIPFDVAKRQLEPSNTYQYLDLNAARDEEIGPKILIEIENSFARSIEVEISEVVFSNSEIWSAPSEPWNSIPSPNAIEEAIPDELAAEQYRLELGQDAIIGYDFGDIWACACGAINHSNEKTCHICGSDHDTVIPVDIEALKERAAERKEAEERTKKEQEALAAAKKKNTRKACLIGISVFLVLCILLTVFVIVPNANRAKKLEVAHGVCSQGLDKAMDIAWDSIALYMIDFKEDFCNSKTITYSKETIQGDNFHCEGKAVWKGECLTGTLYFTVSFTCEGNTKDGTGHFSNIDTDVKIK